jgi:hypothetical protein
MDTFRSHTDLAMRARLVWFIGPDPLERAQAPVAVSSAQAEDL